MTEEREELVRYRVARARMTLAEAEAMAQASLWNGCVNRLYYACFYAATALLLRHGLSSSKHSGVRSLFNREFVRTSAIGRQLGELYNTLFRSRNRGDYDDLVWFEESEVRPWVEQVRQFVARIEALLAAPRQEEPLA